MSLTPDSFIYFVSGMWCTSCAKTVQAGVQQLAGVASADINYSSKLLTVTFREAAEREQERFDQDVCATVSQMGFAIKRQPPGWVQTFRQDLSREHGRAVSLTVLAVAAFLASWSSMVAFAAYLGGLSPSELYGLACLSSALGAPALLLALPPFLKAGFRALYAGRMLTLDLFIGLGGSSALIVSLFNLASGSTKTYIDSSAMVLVILLAAKVLESKLASYLAAQLLSQTEHSDAPVLTFFRGEWRPRPGSTVRRGDRLRFESQDLILFDGSLLNSATVNSHLLNGEAGDLILSEGQSVYAGSIARSHLEMAVEQPLGLRMIDGWAESALLAGSRPHVYSAWIQKLESRLTSFALLGAVALALAELLRGGSAGAAAQAFGIGILIFCPCLFASILPLSKQMAHVALGRMGVILGRPECLFDLSRVDKIYFDKTGTLEAVDSYYLSNDSNSLDQTRQMLRRLALVCPHPILLGLSRTGPAVAVDPAQWAVSETPGQGVWAQDRLTGDSLWVGRPAFVCGGLNLPAPPGEDYPLVALNGKLVGKIITESRFNQVAQECLTRLLAGLPRSTEFSILSGDPKDGAGEALCALNPARISYQGNLSPDEKARLVKGRSLFVGDGLNDTLALAQASVSCRLGQRASGGPADLRLLDGDLRGLIRCFRYSRRFLRVLGQTALLALTYNVVSLTLAATGHFTPLGAVLAMLLSLLLLTASSLRLLSPLAGELKQTPKWPQPVLPGGERSTLGRPERGSSGKVAAG